MKAKVPQTHIARVSAQQLDIGELNAGPISVGKLILDSMEVGMTTGSAKIKNLRVTISLGITLVVIIGFKKVLNTTVTFNLGKLTLPPVPVGDVNVPGLQAITLDIPEAEVDRFAADIGPLKSLKLGPIIMDVVRANELVAPPAGFFFKGIGISELGLDGVAIPAATSSEITIDHIHGQAPLSEVSIPGLKLPQISVGDISSGGLNVDAVPAPRIFTADGGIAKIELTVQPSAFMQIDEFRLSNVKAATSIGSIQLQNVVIPYDVLNLKLSQLGIKTITIPKIRVS